MNNKLFAIGIIILFILESCTLSAIASVNINHATTKSNRIVEQIETHQIDEVLTGDITDITFSDLYPTLGRPIILSLTIQGNPDGPAFKEMINISDSYVGIVVTSNNVKWNSGNVLLYQISMAIGMRKSYTKRVVWYPNIVGNHSVQVQAGPYPVKSKNISVGFGVNAIIYPSLGCPAIINKGKSQNLIVAISEERFSSQDPAYINHVGLESIDGSLKYSLNNGVVLFSTWIPIGRDRVEDELVVWYEISEIPACFYDISVETDKNNYTWPHAVKIIDWEPTKYTFVQLTDGHIGKASNLINEKEELLKKITYINEEIMPEFVIMSGDLVDWCKVKGKHNVFTELQDVIVSCNVPVFTTPGNHERYKHRMLLLYTPFYSLSYYLMYINPITDYAFDYGDIHFVCLDSGYDFSRWEIRLTPEGSGLTNTQMYLLEHDLGNNQTHQIIVMHHPAVNNRNDGRLFGVHDNLPSGNDECIAGNRGNFIDYCLVNNVSLALAGHSHKNKVLNSLGEQPSDLYSWPLFIQTASATLDKSKSGGRIVEIYNGEIENYEYVSFP